jgi:radical SAM protein with 4Fe4S-binding SPASM domain
MLATSSNFELDDGRQIAAWQAKTRDLGPDRSVDVPYPFAVFNIEITNHCPLKCVMCPRTEDMRRPEGLMDFAVFRKIIDELASCNPEWSTEVPVRLHGFGESLVHPRFDEFIAYAEAQGVRTCLSINPILLTPGIAERLLEAAPSLLYVSLDGHDDETFMRIRGLPNAYGRSKANLLRFLELKRSRNTSTRVVLSMIHFFLNDQSLEIAKGYWSEVDGIDQVRVKPFCTWDGNSESVNKLVHLTAAIEPSEAPDRPVTCRWPWTSVTILWDGDVVPCCFDFDKRNVLGNVAMEPIAAIWQGPRMRQLRNEFVTGEVTNNLCRNCASLRA